MDPPAALVARRPVRARVGVGAAIVLVLVGLGIAVLVSAVGPDGATQTVAPLAEKVEPRLRDSAEQAGLNLARPLIDGEQILVPAVGEAPVIAPGATSPGGKININTADETALETLPRVGPAMAKRILDWRAKNGRFTALEDLMSVTGVGQKTFDSLKDLVTL
jgi:competence protein ComEA